MSPTDSDFETQVSMQTETTPIPEDPPFHILFLGDYSGRDNLSAFSQASLPELLPIEIDRDNFETVMKKLNVSLRLDFQGKGVDLLILNFKELDDFHPDRILQQLPLFSELRNLRERLLHPRTFESAAKEVRSWFDKEDVDNTQEIDKDSKSSISNESSGNLLDDILTKKVVDSDSYQTEATDSPELNSFIRKIVSPHLITTDENEQANLISCVDESISELMRRILHHPQFQALESSWRGLYFVVRRTETSNDLKLFVKDVTKDEISFNLKSEKDLTDTALFRELIFDSAKNINGEQFALICGNYNYELTVEDVATLIRLAKIANTANAPFISNISPKMLGIESLALAPNRSHWKFSDETNEAKLWTMLRTIPESKSLGFATPNFLTRLPYGEKTEPTELFSFEEVTDAYEHNNFLWSNPSFACALLLAQSYRSFGWEMGQRLYQELEGFPVYVYNEDGETKTKSSSEVVLSHQSCDVLIDQGFMPLISVKDKDRIRLGVFQSIAFPSKELQARWT